MLKKDWLFTHAGGKEWYIGQDPKAGKFYREFHAPNYATALEKAKKIIQEFEENERKIKSEKIN